MVPLKMYLGLKEALILRNLSTELNFERTDR